jgi:hypothetical protein
LQAASEARSEERSVAARLAPRNVELMVMIVL